MYNHCGNSYYMIDKEDSKGNRREKTRKTGKIKKKMVGSHTTTYKILDSCILYGIYYYNSYKDSLELLNLVIKD